MTIDINELRRKLHSGDIVDHIDTHANVKPVLTEILNRLEAAEKERESWKGLAQQFGNELDTVRAKIAEMERQEPVAIVESWANGSYSRNYKLRWLKDAAEGANLYLAPGAKGENK